MCAVLDVELHVRFPRCQEDEFSDGCARAPSLQRVYLDWQSVSIFQPAKIQKGFHDVCSVFHLKAHAYLGDLKTQTVDCVAFIAQHHHISQIQTGLHVFNIADEMFDRISTGRIPCR